MKGYNKSHQQGIRLTFSEIEFLRGEATRLGISVSDLIRRIVDEYRDARRYQQVRENAARAISTVTNAAGREISFEAAAKRMDHGLSAFLHHGDGQTEQEFFNAYCVMHRAKFGDEFEANKPNPAW
jgi:hypothetical protein